MMDPPDRGRRGEETRLAAAGRDQSGCACPGRGLPGTPRRPGPALHPRLLAPSACRPGQSLVETALALTVLLLVALGTIELALFASAHQFVVSAAQEGARVAAGEGRTLTEGARQTRSLLGLGLGSHAARFTITARCDLVRDDVCRGELVGMQVRGEYPLHMLGTTGLSIPLAVEVRMHVERFRPGL